MRDNYRYRFKEPNFKFPDYYKDYINLYPEEFDNVSNEIKNLKRDEKKTQVEASCINEKQDYNQCVDKVPFLSQFFCFQENHKYYDCISVNQEKFDRYLKFYIHDNKQSYIDYWEKEKEYYDSLQQHNKK